MNKRYQVFVSSTYEDLIEERLEVMKALLELDCIPCGMEYFPAANEDQWTFIKNLIDTCDYYVVIVGGKYGSMDTEGKSYTQKEYEYALSNDIPTIGFTHNDIGVLDKNKVETEKINIEKLRIFTDIVKSKLCKSWTNADQLGAVVSRSLTQLIKTSPRTGWVRSNTIANEDLLVEVNNLRKENDVLKTELTNATDTQIEIKNIADIEETFILHGTAISRTSHDSINVSTKATWKEIFGSISPHLLGNPHNNTVQSILCDNFIKTKHKNGYGHSLDDQVFNTISLQLQAYNLVMVKFTKSTKGDMGLFWYLTNKGKKLMMELRTIKSSDI